MSPAQTQLRTLRDRQSTERGRMATLGLAESLTDETRSELDAIEAGTPDLERQLRAAQVAVDEEERTAKVVKDAEPDGEARERDVLRSRATVGGYLTAALRGRAPSGAEAELQEAAGVDGIPFELWQPPRRAADEERAITEAPGTVGLNLDSLRPAVFSPSIASKLLIDMPVVPSGTYATATISTSATAGAVAKSAAVPDTAATWTAVSTTPHRVGTALDLTLEDIAAVGADNFESVLRQHISLVLADEIDDQLINGTGSGDDLTGVFQRLTDPSAPAATVESWTRFLAIQSGGIDGLWASELSDVAMVCGVETFRLAAATFQGADAEESAAAYLKRVGAAENAFVTNSRMPVKDAHVQQGILCRKGRSMMPSPMRTAVCPVWFGSISIDDIYSGAKKGERYYTLSVMLGDVILVQPSAYSQIAFRVSV